MSKRIRRYKKNNSDNDNLFICKLDKPATPGPLPYDNECDLSKNGAIHLTQMLYIEDNNTFKRYTLEGQDMASVFKI